MDDTFFYNIEMVVDDIEMIDDSKLEGEACITLEMAGVVNVELCDAELASDPCARKGKMCLFCLNATAQRNLQAVISMQRKMEDGRRRIVGTQVFDVNEIFSKLSRNFKNSSSNVVSFDANRDSIIWDRKKSILSETSKPSSERKSLLSQFPQSSEKLLPPISEDKPPTQESIKGVFPLLMGDDITAFITLLLRFSCFGKYLSQTIQVSMLQDADPKLLVKQNPSENVFEFSQLPKQDSALEFCKKLKPTTSYVEPSPSEDHCFPTSQEPCVSPVSSCMIDDQDEFVAEMNGNALVIRVAKDHQVIDETEQKVVNCVPRTCPCPCCPCCPCPLETKPKKKCPCPKSKKCAELPVIRGTLKYPTRMPCDFEYDPCSEEPKNSMQKYRRQRNVGIQSRVMEPSDTWKDGIKPRVSAATEEKRQGIEVCKKGWNDPDTDVFVLKLGRKKGDNHEVELELRTPKCADLDEPNMNTTAVQVYEEEFEDYGKKEAAKVGKKGAKGKGGKKGKGKKK